MKESDSDTVAQSRRAGGRLRESERGEWRIGDGGQVAGSQMVKVEPLYTSLCASIFPS